MIKSRRTSIDPPLVTIRPPFETRVNTSMARSISPASRILIGVTSNPERRRHGLDDGVHAGSRTLVWVPKNCHSRYSWSGLLEQFQPFPAQTVFKRHKAGRVAAGPGETVDETGADRIAGSREHDRHGAGRL